MDAAYLCPPVDDGELSHQVPAGDRIATKMVALQQVRPPPRSPAGSVKERAVAMRAISTGLPLRFTEPARKAIDPAGGRRFGLGRILALHYRSLTLYHIHLHIRCLFFLKRQCDRTLP